MSPTTFDTTTEAGRNTIAIHTMIDAYHRVLVARGERCFDCIMDTEHDLPNGPWPPANNNDATDEDDPNGDYSTAAEWDVYQHAAYIA